MSLEFLSPEAAACDERFSPTARSPMERQAAAAGGRFEARDGWMVAVAFAAPEQESQTLRSAAGWVDCSHLAKLELQAAREDLEAIFSANTSGPLELGLARRAAGAWWCPLTRERLLVLSERSRASSTRSQLELALGGTEHRSASLIDVSTVFAALTIAGPIAREVFARFCAIDLRPQTMPVGAVRPGSVARQPGLVLREGKERFLMLFGWAIGEYMGSQVDDAARHLGGAPVGLDALPPLLEPIETVRAGA